RDAALCRQGLAGPRTRPALDDLVGREGAAGGQCGDRSLAVPAPAVDHNVPVVCRARRNTPWRVEDARKRACASQVEDARERGYWWCAADRERSGPRERPQRSAATCL